MMGGQANGSVARMWSSVVVVGLLWALNPGVLGVIILLLSRPRGVQNLIAYWGGSVLVSVPLVLIPLLMLYFAPTSVTLAHDFATPTSSVARHTQIGMGVFTLAIAAAVVVRYLIRQRRSAPVSARPAARGDEPAGTESLFRRLVRRAYRAWEDGSLWISFVFGMTLFPGPPVALFVVTSIAASGAGIGIQVVAAVAFVVLMLALVEVILVSYLAAPARTQQVLGPIHDWSRAYRMQIMTAILTVVGFWQLLRGLGVL